MNTLIILNAALTEYLRLSDFERARHTENTLSFIRMLRSHSKLNPNVEFDTEHCFENVPPEFIESSMHVLELSNYAWTKTFAVLQNYSCDVTKNYPLD